MNKTSMGIAFVLVGAIASGCGSEVEKRPANGAGGAAEGGSGPSGGTASTGGTMDEGGGGIGGGGGTAEGGAGAGTTGIGEITVVNADDGSGILVAFANEAPEYCTTMADDGTCRFVLCDFDKPAPPMLDGGVVSLAGGLEAASLSFDAMLGRYPSFDASAAIYAPGQMLTVSGAGSAEVPAFSVTFEAPTVAELTAPDLSNLAIDTSQPLAIGWTNGGSVGEVEVRLVSEDPSSPDPYGLICRFPAAAGSGTVSPAMLANLPPTPDQGWLIATHYHDAEATPPGWSILVTAGAYATSAVTSNGFAYAEGFPIQ
ncbi:MAG: hypothetical protein R3B72_45125 [Polyangiaceae bacterium]